MVVRKKDNSYLSRKHIFNLITMPPFIIVFFLAWKHVDRVGWDHAAWFFFIVLFSYGWIVFLWQEYKLSRFRCPMCKQVIINDHKHLEHGAAVTFLCLVCDIEWDTGLSIDRDAD